MLSFAYPWFLLFLPIVPLVGWCRWRRKQPALRVSDARLLTALPAGRSPIVRRADVFLITTAALCLIVALAGPRLPKPTPITTEGIAIMLVVDVSGSMHEPDFDWNGALISRIDAVQRVFQLFVLGGVGPNGRVFSGRPQDLIGLVTFATYPDTAAPLTTSHDVLLKLLKQEPPRQPDEGQTNIGDAIAEGLLHIDEAGARRKVLVLLSDGEHNFAGPATAPTWKPRPSAQRAKDLGVPIYCIDAGSDGPSADPVARASARESLKEVANMTGGEYFMAHDAVALLNVCQNIDRLERRPIETARYRRYREIHTVFGLTGFGCLLLSGLVRSTLGRRLP